MNRLIIFILLLTVGVSAQTSTPASTPFPYFDKVYQTYDKFDDSTTIELEFGLLKGKVGDSLRMNLRSKFSGTKPTSNSNPILITIVSFDIESYSSSSKLIFLVDEERLRPNFVNHKIRRFQSIDDFIEYTSFSISQEDLKKLAFSKKNEGRVDSTEFIINEKSLLLIQDFYKKLVP